MISNCGVLGIDWESASLSAYLEAMETHGEQQAGESGPIQEIQPSDRMARFMKAHSGG